MTYNAKVKEVSKLLLSKMPIKYKMEIHINDINQHLSYCELKHVLP